MDLSNLSKKKKKTYTTGEDDLFPFFSFFLEETREKERQKDMRAIHIFLKY